jgi:hypothetical protein
MERMSTKMLGTELVGGNKTIRDQLSNCKTIGDQLSNGSGSDFQR